MTWSAPSERTRSTFAVLHTPVTSAPNALASCTAKVPTPPDAPMISTCCPGCDLSVVAQALQGGEAGDGDRRRLLEGEVRRLGRELVLAAQRAYSAKAPLPMPNTSSPGWNLVTSLPTASTTPGEVHAQNRVLGRAQPVARQAYRVRQARHDVPDAAVHAGRVHAHQHLVVGDLGPVDVPQLAARRPSRRCPGRSPSCAFLQRACVRTFERQRASHRSAKIPAYAGLFGFFADLCDDVAYPEAKDEVFVRRPGCPT